MIDSEGYRANVAMVVFNDRGRVLWARRVGMDAWQFPQGGIQRNESPEAAAYRELHEEVGLEPRHLKLVAATRGWLRYDLPKRFIRRRSHPRCIGQKQQWFALRLVGRECDVNLQCGPRPEFDAWRWAEYWEPAREVVAFKQAVYRRALAELAPAVAAVLDAGAAAALLAAAPAEPGTRRAG